MTVTLIKRLNPSVISAKCRVFSQRGLTPSAIVLRMEELYAVTLTPERVRRYLAVPSTRMAKERNRLEGNGFKPHRIFVHPEDWDDVRAIVNLRNRARLMALSLEREGT